MYLTVISNHNKGDAHAQNSKSLFIYISAVSESMLLKWTLKTSKEKYKESFLIVVSSWNRDLTLMLERPLSHYWTSPLKVLGKSVGE